jgi:TRAP-type uncharacterized transport system substrate-binding protein
MLELLGIVAVLFFVYTIGYAMGYGRKVDDSAESVELSWGTCSETELYENTDIRLLSILNDEKGMTFECNDGRISKIGREIE